LDRVSPLLSNKTTTSYLKKRTSKKSCWIVVTSFIKQKYYCLPWKNAARYVASLFRKYTTAFLWRPIALSFLISFIREK
jgi:hypothetical protein